MVSRALVDAGDWALRGFAEGVFAEGHSLKGSR
jgi:hypothetical protein